MRIAFDIDGVLYPWTQCATAAANTRGYNIDVMADHTHWNWLPERISAEDWKWLWHGAGLKMMFDQAAMVYPDVEDVLRGLSQRHTLDFVTHRPAAAAPYTARWVAKRNVPFQRLIVLGKQAKSTVLHDVDLFIDDKSDNVEEVLDNTRAFVAAPRRPWNTDLEDLVHPNFLGLYDHPMEVALWVQRQTQTP